MYQIEMKKRQIVHSAQNQTEQKKKQSYYEPMHVIYIIFSQVAVEPVLCFCN